MIKGYWKKVKAMKKDWKSLSPDFKTKYFQLALADRERYLKATAGERRKYERQVVEPIQISGE